MRFLTNKISKTGQSFFWQLLRSHMIIAAIGIFSLFVGLAVIFTQTVSMRLLSGKIIPIVTESSLVLQGVQHSLASLRGWVSLDDDAFVEEWYSAWNEEIHPAISELKQLGLEVNLVGFAGRMTHLDKLLGDLEESQWWVLEVAQTPGNEPAKVRYQFVVEPIFQTIDQLFISLHDSAGAVRQGLNDNNLARLYRAKLTFYNSWSMLEKIILRGELNLVSQYKIITKNIDDDLEFLLKTSGNYKKRHDALLLIKEELAALRLEAAAAIMIRGANNWNVSKYLMETETVPLARKVIAMVKEIDREMETMMDHQTRISDRTGLYGTIGLSILFVVMVGSVFIISSKRASALARPVTVLAHAASQLAAGELKEDIVVSGDDEFAILTNSFNTMRKDLQKTQESLVRQEKLAAIGKLSGSVAHDIRNPLGAISNSIYFLNMIVNEGTNEKIKKHILIMEREIKRVSDIIADLMDFSRENPPLFLKGDINALISQYAKSLSLPENINIKTNLDADLPSFSFDSTQIQRVIDNLLTNAIQAMPAGGDVVIITRQKGANIEIEVKDQGEGIERANLSDIFEPLYTTKAKGVGLGLTITNSFVEKHGGTVLVRSEVGRGTQFIVHLPMGQSGGSDA